MIEKNHIIEKNSRGLAYFDGDDMIQHLPSMPTMHMAATTFIEIIINLCKHETYPSNFQFYNILMSVSIILLPCVSYFYQFFCYQLLMLYVAIEYIHFSLSFCYPGSTEVFVTACSFSQNAMEPRSDENVGVSWQVFAASLLDFAWVETSLIRVRF